MKRGSAYWTTAYPPITMHLTLWSVKVRNRSLKSELTNILSLYLHVVDDHFPGGVETRLGWLGLPEFQVK
jgi:hypothetical protein